MISDLLKRAGFEVIDDGLKVLWNPDAEAINKCVEYGKQLAGYFNK